MNFEICLALALAATACDGENADVTAHATEGDAGTGGTGDAAIADDDAADSEDDADTEDAGDTEETGDTDDTDENGDPAAVCGDGFVEGDEACDLGEANADDGVCKTDCTEQRCGDGFTGPGEGCDDGNDNDDDACSNACALATCGNGRPDRGELCDDGNDDNTDDCLDTCVPASCGDGFVHALTEGCDDANADNTDACLVDCTTASCGDGFVQAGVEGCDDANTDNADDCLSTCVSASCGDGYIQDGVEICDDSINDGSYGGCAPGCLAAGPYCGDGVPNGPETCDDANTSNTDACLNTCVAASCGDGYTHVGTEACDDGDASNTDYCLTTCVLASCGDGFVQAGVEDCDDQNLDETDGCNSVCTNPGGLVWSQTFNGSADLNDFGVDVTTDSEDNVVVLGATGYQSGIVTWWEHNWIRKYNATGQTQWSHIFGGNAASYGVATDTQDNVIALTTTWLPPGQSNLQIVKWDADGNEQWSIVELSGLPEGIDTDSANNIYVAGRLAGDAWLRKYDPNGNQLWEQTYDGIAGGTDDIYDVAVDAGGNVIVVGRTLVAMDDNTAWMRKYNAAGTVQWTQTIASPYEWDQVERIATDSASNLYVITHIDDEDQIRKYSPAGNELWSVDEDLPNLYGIATDADGNVMVTGTFWGGFGDESNFGVRKYDTNGNQIWFSEVPGPDDDESRAIATDSQGFSIVTGHTETEDDGWDIWTGKFAP